MTAGFDRLGQDAGNIVLLEHINLKVPDQILTTDFYISAMGLTRDPFYMVHTRNFWANQGGQQMHLQEGPAMTWRGEIVLVTDILDIVQKALARTPPRLQGTKFSYKAEAKEVLATCPWGNRYRLVSKWPGFEPARGIPCAITEVPPGTSRAIGKFYKEVMGALVETNETPEPQAKVQVGPGQHLIFRETQEDIAPYDGHHICIYAANIQKLYDYFKKRGLVTMEDNKYQFRFQAIIDVDNESTIYELEHEVRSLYHPLYKRELVNRRGDEALP